MNQSKGFCLIAVIISLICLSSCSRHPDLLGPKKPVVVVPVKVVVPPPQPRPATLIASGFYGVVKNALTGAPLLGVDVEITSEFGTNLHVTTDKGGNYRSPHLPAGIYSVNFSLQGFNVLSNVPVKVKFNSYTEVNEALTPPTEEGAYRVVVTWCKYKSKGFVKDIDTYLQVPDRPANSPIAFFHKKGEGVTIDHDETQWLGPETITIDHFLPGTYIYYVNNYNNRADAEALGNSNVHIVVYSGRNVIKQYDVSAGRGITWEAFRFVNGVLDDSRSQVYNDDLFVWHISPLLGPR